MKKPFRRIVKHVGKLIGAQPQVAELVTSLVGI